MRFGDHDPVLARWESQLIAKHPPAGFGDSDARDFDHTSAENHSLAMRGREPVTDEIDYLPRREAVRPHDRLGDLSKGRHTSAGRGRTMAAAMAVARRMFIL